MKSSSIIRAASLSLLLAALAQPASAQLLDKKGMSLAEAKKVAAAAEAEARKNNWNVVIAVLDEGGNIVYLQRMDETQTGSVQVAIDKAKSSVDFKRPTKAFEDALVGGRQAILVLRGASPIEGGIPLMSGGKLVGAIGVSGVTSAQDGQIAKAGADTVK